MEVFFSRTDWTVGLQDDEETHVIGTLFETGSGTAAAAMMYFILIIKRESEMR